MRRSRSRAWQTFVAWKPPVIPGLYRSRRGGILLVGRPAARGSAFDGTVRYSVGSVISFITASPQEETNHIMTSIAGVARAFFDACETGKGWETCSAYCAPNASFSAQAEPLLGIKTLAQYTDWMKSMLTVLPDATYDVKSFATDAERNNVAAYGVFHAT